MIQVHLEVLVIDKDKLMHQLVSDFLANKMMEVYQMQSDKLLKTYKIIYQ